MYEAFFDLKRRPFAATPDPQCFLASGTTQAALDEIVVCVEQGQGIAVVSAPAGTGKTLLCERLRSELTDRFEVVLLRHASFLTRRALLQTILCELNHAYRQQDEQELRLELAPAIRALRPQREALVLICDEAHQLSEDLLEELRILSDLAEQGRPLVRLVLVGQLGLEETLALSSLEALSQRIRAHVCLETLSRAGSLDYIDYRLTWAGGRTDDIFTAEAMELVSRAADGVPRCLNQLCDHALLLAYVAEQRPVSAETIREALQDLRQLPLHWNESSLTEPTRVASAASFEAEPDFDEATEEATFEESHSTEAAAEMESIEIGADLPRRNWLSSAPTVGPIVSILKENALISEPALVTTPTVTATYVSGDDPSPRVTDERLSSETMLESPASWEVGCVASMIVPLAPSAAAVVETIPSQTQMSGVSGGGFVEELVQDRYAAIDAGLEPTELIVSDTVAPPEVRTTTAAEPQSTFETLVMGLEQESWRLAADAEPAKETESFAETTVNTEQSLTSPQPLSLDADFEDVCERLEELLPKIEDNASWDSACLRDDLVADTTNASLLDSFHNEYGHAVETVSMEDRLGNEVCQLAEQLQRTLGLPQRTNSPVAQLRSLLSPACEEDLAITESIEIGSDSTQQFASGLETVSRSSTNANGSLSERMPTEPASTRPYRNLFSQLRRKQQGLL